MIKTHHNSRFVLLSLEGIRDAGDVVLQAEKTGSNFEGGKACYLCEVVSRAEYNSTEHKESLMTEICRLNEERRRLQRRVERLEKELKRGQDDGASKEV